MPPSKRRSSPIDLTAGDEASGSNKRARLVVKLARQPGGSASTSAAATPAAARDDEDDDDDLHEADFQSDDSGDDYDGGERRTRLKVATGRRKGGGAAAAGPSRTSGRRAAPVAAAHDDDSTSDSEAEGPRTPPDAAAAGVDAEAAALAASDGDFSALTLKADHASRPLWINPSDRHIILEGFSAIAEQAMDFLVAIAEPVSRPAFIHEYKLTMYSLFAAVSVGLQPSDILEVLNRLSKSPVPPSVADFIMENTRSFGKVKLVLKQNRYYIESAHADVLRMLLQDEVVGAARIRADEERSAGRLEVLGKAAAPKRGDLVIPGTEGAARKAGSAAVATAAAVAGGAPQIGARPGSRPTPAPAPAAPGTAAAAGRLPPGTSAAGAAANAAAAAPGPADADLFSAIIGVDDEGEDTAGIDEDDVVHSFEILEGAMEDVRRRCNDIGYPMLEEYDFRNDRLNADLEIDLKPVTHIRPYQEKSLSKMFGNGRARSGIIVLPCGAGKTLVGITAACTIKKSCLVLCTSSVSVMQWKREFMQWSNIQDSQISVFTADQKEKFSGAAGIVVSTYSMVANTGKRSHTSQKMMNFLESREWGFILLDEVHVVPASMFRRVLTKIKAHSKLGLTATLVREDEKIDELNFLVGPKLYEANWMDLAAKGHIATVQCAEVWCPMTPEFYREYLREKTRKKMLLYCMNPEKFQACQFLINYHETRGDKIIVFSDNVFALEAYAKKLKKPYIHGGTAQAERMRILQHFQHNPQINTIFLSKVGDTSIDLPEATCLIQISSHFGSRRQEAQRLGRILRAKRRNDEGFNAFFYSLVSKDTAEMFYSTKRQQFLIDQGYSFRVITNLVGKQEMPDLVYKTQSEQIELLQSVLIANESAADLGSDMVGAQWDPETGAGGARRGPQQRIGGPATAKATRTTGSLGALSGANEMSYVERNQSANKRLAKDRNPLFKKRAQNNKQRTKDDD